MKWIALTCSLFLPLLTICQSHSQDHKKHTENLVNPIPRTIVNIKKGKEVFIHHCASCHGKKGRGDGIGGITLDKPPADFQRSIQDKSDADLYWEIALGKKPMREYEDVFKDKEIWNVINYIRSLSNDSVK